MERENRSSLRAAEMLEVTNRKNKPCRNFTPEQQTLVGLTGVSCGKCRTVNSREGQLATRGERRTMQTLF